MNSNNTKQYATETVMAAKMYITCEKFWTVLISDKKVSENKTVRNSRYSKTTLVSRNKTDVIRKGLKMAGIVEAVTKELEPEVPFKILVID